MYSRDFGSIRSDGQLRELEKNWQKQYTENIRHEEPKSETIYIPVQPQPEPVQENSEKPAEKKPLFGFNLDFLKNIQVDDLILIGIGILLLLDSDTSNDMLIILIAMMLFF